MEQYGNTSTFNLESVLLQNIKRSQYWEKRAKDIADYDELVDEIYETVDNVEPWMSGNARGPSTAFNLLYRLCQLKPDVRQVRQMLDHRDSPFIRAIGLLYLRYVCDPRQLWEWFRTYLRDEEDFEPSPAGLGRSVTIGEFARDIMLDQVGRHANFAWPASSLCEKKNVSFFGSGGPFGLASPFYFETIFPRVPKPVHDDICGRLKEMGLPTAVVGNAGQGGADRRGVNDGAARPASVKASLSVAFGQRAPNRAGAREQGRGMGSELQAGSSRQRSLSPYKREERPASRGDNRRERPDDRKVDRSDQRYADHRHGRRRGDERRDDRDTRRDQGYRENMREQGHREDRRRDRDFERGSRHEREDGNGRRGQQRRSRSRERLRSRSRDARDVFRDRAAAVHVNPDKIKDTYG
ncbi:Pre-mRNA splicing factor SR-like 1 [Chlorella vulgaris]